MISKKGNIEFADRTIAVGIFGVEMVFAMLMSSMMFCKQIMRFMYRNSKQHNSCKSKGKCFQ